MMIGIASVMAVDYSMPGAAKMQKAVHGPTGGVFSLQGLDQHLVALVDGS